jgi:hypothetical protein
MLMEYHNQYQKYILNHVYEYQLLTSMPISYMKPTEHIPCNQQLYCIDCARIFINVKYSNTKQKFSVTFPLFYLLDGRYPSAKISLCN